MAQDHFERVLAAEGVSNFGSMLSRLAIPWLATLGLGASAMQMSALVVADVLAAALGGVLLAGRVDRGHPRRVMLACDALRAGLLAAVALAAWRGALDMAALVLAAAAQGLLTMAFELARSAWMARRLPPESLVHRNAQLSAAGSVSEALAFGAGGWLFQSLGAALSLLVDALSFLGSALCLRGVAEAPPQARAPADPAAPVPRLRTLLIDAADGLRLVAGHPALRALAGIELLLAAGMGLFGTCFMIFVVRDAGFATGPLGLVFATGALGAMAGAWAAPALGRRLGAGGAMACGLLLLTLGNGCVLLVPGAGAFGLGLLLVHQLVGDGGHVLRDVHDRTLRQTLVGPDRLARADAGVRLAGQLSLLAAALLGGALGDALGARSALALAVALYAAATLWSAATRARFQSA